MQGEVDLDAFKEWLLARGRALGTAESYSSDLSHALVLKDPTKVLREPKSSKTLHRRRAALKAWAHFVRDQDLLERIADVKLPSIFNRAKVAIPFSESEWKSLRAAIDALPDVGTKAVLGMMAARGFRVGDVLRMGHEEVVLAIESGVLLYEAKGRKKISWGTSRFESYLELLASVKGWKRVIDLLTSGPEIEGLSEEARMKRRTHAAIWRLHRELRKLAASVGAQGRVYPHRLRRTYAVYALKAFQKKGMGLEALKAHMDWAELSTAENYVDGIKRDELDELVDGI